MKKLYLRFVNFLANIYKHVLLKRKIKRYNNKHLTKLYVELIQYRKQYKSSPHMTKGDIDYTYRFTHKLMLKRGLIH